MAACKRLILVAVAVLLAAAILAACVSWSGAPVDAAATPASGAPPNARLTPALPDPQIDPLAALTYSKQPGVLQSAAISVADVVTASQTVGGGYLPYFWPGDPPPETAERQATRVAAEATVMAAPPREQPIMTSEQRGSGALRVVEVAAGGVDYHLDCAQSYAMFVQDMRIGDSGSTGECMKVGPALWTRLEAGQWTPKSDVSLLAPDAALQAAWSATAAQWVGQESLNGEPVHHLTFASPHLQQLRFLGGNDKILWDWTSGFEGLESDLAAEPITPTIRADAWLGSGDLLPRQLTFSLEATSVAPSLRLRLVLIRRHALVLSDLNRPVVIEPPSVGTPVPTP